MGKWAAAASDAAKAYNSSAPYSVTKLVNRLSTMLRTMHGFWDRSDYGRLSVKIDIVNSCCPIKYILLPMVIEACVITTK